MAQLIVLPVTSRTSPQPVPTLCLEGIQNISLTVISKYRHQISHQEGLRYSTSTFKHLTSNLLCYFFLRLVHSSSNLIG